MKYKRKPEWLKIRLPEPEKYHEINKLLKELDLHTICVSGKCPNMGECWNRGTATFMILGDICTRACKFCNVKTGNPLPVDSNEPVKIARAIKSLKLKHAVLTSVDRDDLPDKGAGLWAETIKEIKKMNPLVTMETLIPDFDGLYDLLDLIVEAAPEVVSHNMETVERLSNQIRSKAKYDRSLDVLRYLASKGVNVKSGIMLGLGEKREEIEQVMDDLLSVNCYVLTIGQYLQPSSWNLPVDRYVTPEEFEELKQIALSKGFKIVESAPLVRSSYHAENHILKN